MWAEAGALGGTESDQRAHRRWGFRAGLTLGPSTRLAGAGGRGQEVYHLPLVCLAQVPQRLSTSRHQGKEKNSSPFTEQEAEARGGK